MTQTQVLHRLTCGRWFLDSRHVGLHNDTSPRRRQVSLEGSTTHLNTESDHPPSEQNRTLRTIATFTGEDTMLALAMFGVAAARGGEYHLTHTHSDNHTLFMRPWRSCCATWPLFRSHLTSSSRLCETRWWLCTSMLDKTRVSRLST